VAWRSVGLWCEGLGGVRGRWFASEWTTNQFSGWRIEYFTNFISKRSTTICCAHFCFANILASIFLIFLPISLPWFIHSVLHSNSKPSGKNYSGARLSFMKLSSFTMSSSQSRVSFWFSSFPSSICCWSLSIFNSFTRMFACLTASSYRLCLRIMNMRFLHSIKRIQLPPSLVDWLHQTATCTSS